MRVNAWVSGGAVPAARRGLKLDGLTTIWDWCLLRQIFLLSLSPARSTGFV